jgi:hypothetical protein
MSEHDYDLDAILRESKKPPRRGAPAPRSFRKPMMGVAGAALLLLVIRSTMCGGTSEAMPENIAELKGVQNKFSVLYEIDGDWIAVASPDWIGALDPSHARDICPTITRFLGMEVGEILSIQTPSGQTMAECERL